jgi:hypothetical protein
LTFQVGLIDRHCRGSEDLQLVPIAMKRSAHADIGFSLNVV